jgi:hypothetical protein
MRTDFFEADPFGGSKGALLSSLETDYRWEKGDEVWIDAGGKRVKIRVTWVNVTVKDGDVSREILGLKL